MEGLPLYMKYQIPIEGYERFWEGLKKGEIVATRCKRCGNEYFPPRVNCTCGSSDMEWFEVKREGIVQTFSEVFSKPQGFEDFSYIVGIVNVGNLNLMCWLVGKPRVGSRVMLRTDGTRVIGDVVD
ncbi:DNA-binding protein [Sulfolobales archaeon HS-7]|nr:DNA-binding protein [Sulfolobales archaeon HS-7]